MLVSDLVLVVHEELLIEAGFVASLEGFFGLLDEQLVPLDGSLAELV